jgi:hypothetical protein
MTILYVIDTTSRQYSFEIKNKPIDLIVDGVVQEITKENLNIETFHNIVLNKKTFSLISRENAITFNGDKIIGIQIYFPKQQEEESTKEVE